MIIILMGVCGSGKTTIGELLAKKLNCDFSDADSFHPEENIEKMRVGIPLQDDDRWPWLNNLRRAIENWQEQNVSHILACSALKQSYRDILAPNNDENIIFVNLKGSPELILKRLKARKDHYMNPDLLQSQFDALEEPQDALTISIEGTPDEITEDILTKLP